MIPTSEDVDRMERGIKARIKDSGAAQIEAIALFADVEVFAAALREALDRIGKICDHSQPAERKECGVRTDIRCSHDRQPAEPSALERARGRFRSLFDRHIGMIRADSSSDGVLPHVDDAFGSLIAAERADAAREAVKDFKKEHGL